MECEFVLIDKCSFGQNFLEWTRSFTFDLDWLLAARKSDYRLRNNILLRNNYFQDKLSIPFNVYQMKSFTNYVYQLACENDMLQATSILEYKTAIFRYCNSSQKPSWSHVAFTIFMLLNFLS